ncbi:MAG: glycosyltransferase family 4 protein [Oscillospiraceae bacterium]|nr:glycosyltransferase family 4 protein [Oscillospiraceae bacterium]
MKVLFVATITAHINSFHLPYLKWFKEQGWEVHVASNGDEAIPYCDVRHHLSVQRSPFKLQNIKAYRQLKQIIKNEGLDIVHGHTPMGGMLTRLCGKSRRKHGTKVMYTAHGFHFFKGAPKLNWSLYYPVEKMLARYTDALITINKEDYERANRKLKAKKIHYIHGIGVDTSKFANVVVDRDMKRAELGLPSDATVVMSVGELNANKNHQVIIKALAETQRDDLHYIICGSGGSLGSLQKLCSDLNLSERVHFLGYRTDIGELLKASDVFAFPSFREGLPVSLMEAMSAGLPCVVSGIRGNSDLIEHEKGGFLCNPSSASDFKNGILKAIDNPEIGQYNKTAVMKFDIASVMEEMQAIYILN